MPDSSLNYRQALNERLFRILIEQSADAVFLTDAHGIILYISPSTQRILGYTSDELLGRNAFELLHPDDLEHMIRGLSIVLEQGGVPSIEYRARHKDGSWRWLEATATNLLNEPGVEAIVSNYRDITERKLLEDKIWKNEQLLQKIVDDSPAAIYVKDVQGHFILVNRHSAEIFHLTKEQLTDKTDYDILPKEIADTVRANDQEVLATRRAQEWEEVILQDDGLHTYISVKFPLFDAAGEPYAVCGISTDITERKLMEQRKDDFISMASHELKTPLTSVRVYAQLLQMKFGEVSEPEAQLYLSKMNIQIDKLINLITGLLDVPKMQTGKIVFAEDTFDVDEMVREVVENVQQTIPQHHLLIEGAATCTFVGDRDRLGQVVNNLISNAIKYSPQAEKVVVHLSQTPQQVTVSIQDFGIGIPIQHQKHIFERFYRGHIDKEKSFPGLGIGLYIAHEIIEHYGGKIWVESVEGEGSIFSFSLPLKEKDSQ